MIEMRSNQYAPDVVSPPGETLEETIEVLGMSQAELAERMGRLNSEPALPQHRGDRNLHVLVERDVTPDAAPVPRANQCVPKRARYRLASRTDRTQAVRSQTHHWRVG